MLLVGVDGEVIERAPDQTAYQPSALVKWLSEKLAAYERDHPSTRVPLVRAEVKGEGEGDGKKYRCETLDRAREEERPALLYFGRDSSPDDDRKLRKQCEAALKFEGKTLDSRSVAEAAEGWTLLRFDLANEDHARFAKELGVTKAPHVLLVVPGEEKPVDLGDPSPGSLRYQLKKHAD